MNDYKTYELLDDSKLLDLIRSGDMHASFYLIEIKYQTELKGLIYNHFKSFGINLSSDELEYWIDMFKNYMDSPTKIDRKNQFENIKYKNNIRSWLCQCCKYFLFNYGKIENRISYIDPAYVYTDGYCHIDFDTEESDKNILKLKMADYFFNSLSDRDIYVIYTYLYCIEKGISTRYIDEKIAAVLIHNGCKDMSANQVRIIKSRSIAKAKNKILKK